MLIINNDYFTYSFDDFRFTEKAFREWKTLFALGGIDMNCITDYESYLLAREECAEYFMQWLEDHVASWPNTADYNLLRAALSEMENPIQWH